MIALKNTASTSNILNKNQSVIVKYLYGLLDESDTDTTLSTASTAGSSVSIEVADTSSFTANDWVILYGTDGHREVAQVSSITDGTNMVIDQLVDTHDTSTKIIKLECPYFIKRFMEIEAAIYIAINAIGSTYTFNTNYSLGEMSVSKGVPYPHFSTQVQKLIAERNRLSEMIKPRPYIRV